MSRGRRTFPRKRLAKTAALFAAWSVMLACGGEVPRTPRPEPVRRSRPCVIQRLGLALESWQSESLLRLADELDRALDARLATTGCAPNSVDERLLDLMIVEQCAQANDGCLLEGMHSIERRSGTPRRIDYVLFGTITGAGETGEFGVLDLRSRKSRRAQIELSNRTASEIADEVLARTFVRSRDY